MWVAVATVRSRLGRFFWRPFGKPKRRWRGGLLKLSKSSHRRTTSYKIVTRKLRVFRRWGERPDCLSGRDSSMLEEYSVIAHLLRSFSTAC